jgi:hypothetical protein
LWNGVVDIEELRHFAPPSQVKQPYHPPAAKRSGVSHGIVIEPARDRHPDGRFV